MNMMLHPGTDLAIGDPHNDPLSRKPSPKAARTFFDSLILSASGWRGVFGSSDDDLSEELGPDRLYVAARMADVFADFLSSSSSAKPIIALGLDTRPSGPAIANAMLRIFLARGIEVRYAFIIAAPEIMAWAKRSGALPEGHPDRISAFCYVSASHNPPGHNGVKFGLVDGGVLPGDQARLLIDHLREEACMAADIDRLAALSSSVDPKTVAAVFSSCGLNKRKAISDYTLFARETAGASDDLETQERALDELASAVESRGVGIIAEMNGSARALSIDVDFLASLGAHVHTVNARPRAFVHRIVPEGASLDQCRMELQSARERDPGFAFGYVPDCDGDRGNIVAWDRSAGSARALEAQETFALATLSELAELERRRIVSGKNAVKTAVVANDATSMRIEAIASIFGAAVFRAETGEANVVGLARRLRNEGWLVRILGEGSNGGVITHPASVRDPLNTITALLKLVYLRNMDGTPGPYRLWLERSGQDRKWKDDFELADVAASLPPFVTTSVFEDRAALKVVSRDQVALKRAYGGLFRSSWHDLAGELEPHLGRLSWRAMATRGMDELPLGDDFGESGTGGLRILLEDERSQPAAFLWMRGSGTEPVFRVMVDV
ncbi:MAG: phosphatidylglycerol lysyltransferase, partial [Spirochaetales bacterium]